MSDLEKIEELIKKKLAEYIKADKRNLKIITEIIVGIIKCKTVILYTIAQSFLGLTLIESKERKIERFIRKFNFPEIALANLIVSILGLKTFELLIDRTQWEIAEFKANIFAVCVRFHSVAVPIFFHCLHEKGCTDDELRISMIQKAIEAFGLRSIQAVYADREFPSQKFLQFLSDLEIQFVFRIKNNTNLSGRKAEDYAKHLFQGQEIQLGKKKFLGVQAYVVLTLTEKGDLMAIASHHPIEANIYRRRWSIETMFRKFKTDGFNLESSRLKSRERLTKLFALLSI